MQWKLQVLVVIFKQSPIPTYTQSLSIRKSHSIKGQVTQTQTKRANILFPTGNENYYLQQLWLSYQVSTVSKRK